MENQVLDDEVLINENKEVEAKWAGFWIRVGASLIDFAVLLPFVALNLYNLYVQKILPLQLLIAIPMFLYKPFMEYRYGATFGKMAVKIKVVNKELGQITAMQSILRYTPWILSQALSLYSTIALYQHPEFQSTTGWIEVGLLQNELVDTSLSSLNSLIFIVSCVVVGLTQYKQGIHDMIAGTYCIYKE